MRIKIILSVFIICNSSLLRAQTAPADSIATIDGNNISLYQFQPKKIFLVTMPVSSNEVAAANAMLLESIYQQYKDNVEFIGVLSSEDGYADSLLSSIKSWYRDSLHISFPVTTGINTRNSSGETQHILLKWLSLATLNGHFETVVLGTGQKFILDSSGRLISVLDAATPINSHLMGRMISRQ
ncbi:MAG: hypothetical protein QM791_18540 [Ferruginibacter sp.]